MIWGYSCAFLMITGKDATQDFDEIGHSNSAKKMLDKYLIGKYKVWGCNAMDDERHSGPMRHLHGAPCRHGAHDSQVS